MGFKTAEAYANSFQKRASELTAKMTGFSLDEKGLLQPTGGVSLGLNPSQVMNYQAMFGQMASSIGTTSEQATKLSNVLTMIGADLASVKNMDFEKVWTDMASGLAGMSRTLDKYGANIRNVNLQEKLLEIGINTNIQELNQNDKALLRTIILLDSTRYAWGDMSDTISQPANQLRLLSANFQNLARSIGNLFMPILQKVLPYINGLTIALQRLMVWVGTMMGVDLSGITSTGSGGDSLSDILGTEDAEEGVDGVTSSIKKLKTAVLGIDELNILSFDDSSNGLSSGLGGLNNSILNAEFDRIVKEYTAAWETAYASIENKAQSIADTIINAFKKGDYKSIGITIGDGITNALKGIKWASVFKGANTFGENFANFMNGLISPELFGTVGITIANSLNTAVQTAFSFGTEFDFENAGVSIGTAINKFFETFDFGLLAKTLSVWADGIFDEVTKAIGTIEWDLVAEKIVEFISNLELGEIVVDLAKLTFNVLDAVFEFARSFEEMAFFAIAKALGFDFESEKGQQVKKALEAVFDVRAEINSPFKSADDLLDKIFPDDNGKNKVHSGSGGRIHSGGGISFDVNIESNEESLTTTKESLNNWSATTGTIFTMFKEENMEKIAGFTTDSVVKFAGWEKNTGTIIRNWWNKDIVPQFDKKKWDNQLVSIPQSFFGAFSSAESIALNAINNISSAIDGLIGKINSLNVSTNGIGGIAQISIPGYANGGIVRSADVFTANENGVPEFIGTIGGHTAVANNEMIVDGIKEGVREAVAEVLAPYLADIVRNTRETAEKDLTVAIGDREIARANARGQRSMGLALITE